MDTVDPQEFQDTIQTIKNGTIFEAFACDFLSQVIGGNFIPMGGIHDLGIDAALYIQNEDDSYKIIYQISTDESKQKIINTIDKLKRNGIVFSELCFITNEVVKKQDEIRTEVFKRFNTLLSVHDILWLRGQANTSLGAIRVFKSFLDRYYHEFKHVGTTKIVADFDGDPRIFIFLRQQLEHADSIADLSSFVIDNLIVFSLEGTDPDNGILLSKKDIISKISSIAPFKIDESFFDTRLKFLSSKPRKIKHHTREDAYCLPYETRQEIQALNIHDQAIIQRFKVSISTRLPTEKIGPCFSIDELVDAIILIFNSIFKSSGLEFSNFILNEGSTRTVSQDLPSLVQSMVENRYKTLDHSRKDFLSKILQNTIREIIYNVSSEEKDFLVALSKTYMTLFMLNVDPKISQYLTTMANGLEIFVCSSILIPALSESKASEKDRRLWNLLKGAHAAGVKFYINSAILDEIVRHIENKITEYQNNYENCEYLYTNREMISCIDSILIRGYFYHKSLDNSLTFIRYIDDFVDPASTTAEKRYELREFFRETFGIEFYSKEDELLKLVDETDLNILTDTLGNNKPSRAQAINDAKTILMIYAKRKRDNEEMSGALGYRTWWLSTDTTTFAAVESCLNEKYRPSCYIRPDFLANFISISPHAKDVEKAYDNIFPNTLGVSLSRHIDGGFTRAIAACMKQHSGYRQSRIKTIIHTKIDRLKSEFQLRGKRGLIKYIETLYDERDDL